METTSGGSFADQSIPLRLRKAAKKKTNEKRKKKSKNYRKKNRSVDQLDRAGVRGPIGIFNGGSSFVFFLVFLLFFSRGLVNRSFWCSRCSFVFSLFLLFFYLFFFWVETGSLGFGWVNGDCVDRPCSSIDGGSLSCFTEFYWVLLGFPWFDWV